MPRFRRDLSDPQFEQGAQSEWERALETIRSEVIVVLADDYREVLTMEQIKTIADEVARRVLPKLDVI